MKPQPSVDVDLQPSAFIYETAIGGFKAIVRVNRGASDGDVMISAPGLVTREGQPNNTAITTRSDPKECREIAAFFEQLAELLEKGGCR